MRPRGLAITDFKMRCEQAQTLFDAYLNGELSASLATELGAHRVQCASCRRAMALLEVTGHIVRSDDEPASLKGGFSERLLACMEAQPVSRSQRLRRGLYIVGSLAAAAVVALALIGVFDGREAMVAGEKVQRVVDPADGSFDAAIERGLLGTRERDDDPDAVRLDEWAERARENLAAKRERSETLQKAFGQTMDQLLEALEQAAPTPPVDRQGSSPGDPQTGPPVNADRPDSAEGTGS